MADPVTILCSILTIADASKKVLDVCTEYFAHARNAPKELQTLIEDAHALNGTMKRLDSLAKSSKRTARYPDQFDQWQLPLKRIKNYAKSLDQLISKQDMKVGILHELKFRARWPQNWRVVESLLQNIRAEKNELQLVTNVHEAEMIGMLYKIVDERLPRDHPVVPRDSEPYGSSIPWEKVDQKHCSPDQQQAFVLRELGIMIGWGMAVHEYPPCDDLHQYNVDRSAEYTKEAFLESKVYQAWKSRKTRGPGLICATGSATTGKTTLCCRVIQDLRSLENSDVGIAYYYFGAGDSHEFAIIRLLQYWIIQLATQCGSIPQTFPSGNLTAQQLRPQRAIREDNYQAWIGFLRSLLLSLFTIFRRTFLFIDGLDESRYIQRVMPLLKEVLEQDFGNVSIAVFSRPLEELEPLLQLADVTIRLTQFEPDLSEYIRLKVDQDIKPMLAAEYLDHDRDSLAAIENVMTEASSGLYLGVDVLIDSLAAAIRKGRNIPTFLREIRENNEIMLQRDPESMKQKAFGIETPSPVSEGAGSAGLGKKPD